MTGRIPEWLNNIIYKLPLARYADIRRRNAIAQEYAVGVIRERKKAIAANPSQEGEAEDILTSFSKANHLVNQHDNATYKYYCHCYCHILQSVPIHLKIRSCSFQTRNSLRRSGEKQKPGHAVKRYIAVNIHRPLKRASTLLVIRTMIFAGHDSTTHTMSYILYMLAKHPDAQEKVRQEVTALLDSDPTADDFDSSPWLNAAIRVCDHLTLSTAQI